VSAPERPLDAERLAELTLDLGDAVAIQLEQDALYGYMRRACRAARVPGPPERRRAVRLPGPARPRHGMRLVKGGGR
jgi:hypothetical protein